METEMKPLWATIREAMGKTWSVELLPDSGPFHEDRPLRDMGASFSNKDYVRINAALSPQNRDLTLLHELLHLSADVPRTHIKEDTVEALASALYAFLRGFGLWREFPWPDKEEKDGTDDAR